MERLLPLPWCLPARSRSGEGRGEGGGEGEHGSLLPFTEILSKEFPAVFVVVAVNAQVLPVRSIGRVVQMIAIFVVDG